MKRNPTTLRVRKARPFWKDPRFLAGIALIAFSVLACTWLIVEARAGDPVYVTTRAIAQGERLDASNTAIVDVRVDTDAYLVGGQLPSGAVANHSLSEGELVAAAAVSTVPDSSKRRLLLEVAQGLPESVQVGDRIELWHVPAGTLGGDAPTEGPGVIADNVTLISIKSDTTAIPGAGSRIEVLLDADDVSPVLRASSGKGTLAAVPIGQP